MKKQVRILALDMATSTGWALLGRKGRVSSGVVSFEPTRGESPGMRFLRFRLWLADILECERPDVIAFERAHHRGGAATAVGVGLMTQMQTEAARLGIETLPVHSSTLKKYATGTGKASKDAMRGACWSAWRFLPLSDDEADARCTLAWAAHELKVTIYFPPWQGGRIQVGKR